MSALLDLAARIEGLEGPDRGADRLIQFHVFSRPMPDGYRWADYAPIYAGKKFAGFIDEDGVPLLTNHAAPLFTASLDAAMSLVPEGWAWRVDWRPDGLDLPRGADPEPAIGMVYRGIGQARLGKSTMAVRALCAAALRARASNGGE